MVSYALALGIAFVIGVPDNTDEVLKKERAHMAGTWKIIASELDGNRPHTKDELANLLLTIDAKGKMTLQRAGDTIAEHASEIDPTKTPKTMDQTFAIGDGRRRTSLAIYELKGDTLKCCFAPPGGARPTEFSSKGNSLVVYQRTKGK